MIKMVSFVGAAYSRKLVSCIGSLTTGRNHGSKLDELEEAWSYNSKGDPRIMHRNRGLNLEILD